MVGTFLRRTVSGIALACAGVGLTWGTAAAQPTDYHYETAIKAIYGSPYPITGRLDLEIFPDGTLRGHYHTTFYKLYVPVAGGRDGNYIWFDIGPSDIDLGLGAGPQGKLHVVATMNADGSFRGQVYPETAAVLSGPSMQSAFSSAPPASGNGNDQYIFSATPTTVPEVTATP